jgi:hypothetical protein
LHDAKQAVSAINAAFGKKLMQVMFIGVQMARNPRGKLKDLTKAGDDMASFANSLSAFNPYCVFESFPLHEILLKLGQSTVLFSTICLDSRTSPPSIVRCFASLPNLARWNSAHN